jgi:hypothetical protein
LGSSAVDLKLQKSQIRGHDIAGLTIAAVSLERSGALLVFTDGRWMHTNTSIFPCDILGEEFGLAESAVRLGMVSDVEVQEHRTHVRREHAEREAKFEYLHYLRLKEKYEGST